MKLTPRQYEYARLCATNVPRAEIARRLGVKVTGVNAALERIFKKAGISSRRQLAPLLLSCTVRQRHGGGSSRLGVEPGDPVRIIGGRFVGKSATYVGNFNSRQVRVQVGGGVFAVRRWFVEPIRSAA